MGVIVSKSSQNRAKKVQQTAAVVTALKTASKNQNNNPNLTLSSQGYQDSPKLGSGDESLATADRHEFEKEVSCSLNNDKSSLTYGLPELEAGADSNTQSGGTTGYWNPNDKSAVTVPYFGAWKNKVENDELCSICGAYTGSDVHPCRVCAKVYHEICLRKKGKLYDPTEMEAFRQANKDKGWSCYSCESLTSLLTDEEMQQLIENFDRLDVNQDTQITEEEYVKYRKAQYKDVHKEEMPVEMTEDSKTEFKMMDKDQTGTIDWWEFLNHEALKVIGKNRSKFQLVRMLSPLEIQRARDIFHAFDKDEDGYINSYEMAQGFTRWFGNLRIFNSDQERYSGNVFGKSLDPTDVSGHIDRQTRILMDADSDHNRLVSWDEYLREQSLYILAARPN